LIEAAGKPPVQDIEGTHAPRKPLAENADPKKEQPVTVSNPPLAKKRGRPPNKTKANNQTPTAVESGSDDSVETPHTDTAEVIAIYFSFLFVLLIPGRLFSAPNTSCFLLFMDKRIT
jgi:hypothetical protein